ncbi:MAG TPA: hypothetical protein VGM98_21800 [Schlesneria sp.]|jgi:hypothetical protein
MTQRNRISRTAIVLALLAISSVVLWRYLALWWYHAYILEHYSTEIAQLETAMQQWPADLLQDDAYERKQTLRAELKQTFSSGDFYYAGWSYDSHHGAQGTGLPGGGFSSSPWVSSIGVHRDSLYFGKSFEGAPLLVYQKSLPKNRVMRHIVVVLYRDKVDQSMKANRNAVSARSSGQLTSIDPDAGQYR